MWLGQEEARRVFEADLASGRLHHAWLLEGPKGIGKRAFADWAALRLMGPEAASLIAAESHPDHRLLAPPEEGKGAATGTIPIDQVRGLKPFLHAHPALAAWRVVIVDSIDDLARNAANALLKELEEPAPQTLLLLVSHAPGRLLPTIRSRCRRLRFPPIAEVELARWLSTTRPEVAAKDLAMVARLARGSPGDALRLLDGDALKLRDELSGEAPATLARQFQGGGARYRLLLDLAPRLLADAARQGGDAGLVEAQVEAEELAASARGLALDPVQTAFTLIKALKPALARQPSGRQGRAEMI
jgi:DNA polymerase-3 subunit delta'